MLFTLFPNWNEAFIRSMHLIEELRVTRVTSTLLIPQ